MPTSSPDSTSPKQPITTADHGAGWGGAYGGSMSINRQRRRRLAVQSALSYPLVWAGAAIVAFGASLTGDPKADTGGLGEAIAGFMFGLLVLSVAWAVLTLLATKPHAQPVRNWIAALGTPLFITTAVFWIRPVGIALALLLPAWASWWATMSRTAPSNRRRWWA
jgi:hypothetical protein